MLQRRILVVEDDRLTIEIMRLYLEMDGHLVHSAHDGKEGLATALGGSYDMIVLDMMLPSLSGLEILRQLRAVSEVPIIMVTARATDEDRILGLELGADDFITKPFSPREFAARVRAKLRRFGDDVPVTS